MDEPLGDAQLQQQVPALPIPDHDAVGPAEDVGGVPPVPPPELGRNILAEEGCPRREGRLTVGWAVKSRKPNKDFLREVEKCILWLREEYGADSVLIPFFHDEDVGICQAVAARLDGQAGCLRKKHLSEETLSIIGCMDVLVGDRADALAVDEGPLPQQLGQPEEEQVIEDAAAAGGVL